MEPTTATRAAAPAVNKETQAAGHLRSVYPRRIGGATDDTGRHFSPNEPATGGVPKGVRAAASEPVRPALPRTVELQDDAPAPGSTSQAAFGGVDGQSDAEKANVPRTFPEAATAAGNGAIAQTHARVSPAAGEGAARIRSGSGSGAVVGGCVPGDEATEAAGRQVAGVRGRVAAAVSRLAPDTAQGLLGREADQGPVAEQHTDARGKAQHAPRSWPLPQPSRKAVAPPHPHAAGDASQQAASRASQDPGRPSSQAPPPPPALPLARHRRPDATGGTIDGGDNGVRRSQTDDQLPRMQSLPAAPLSGDRQLGTRREPEAAQVASEGAAPDGEEMPPPPSSLPYIPPIVTPPSLPPNFMQEMCTVLWEHVIKAEAEAAARQARQQGQEGTPSGGALLTARNDHPTGPEAPAVLAAVRYLQANELPLGLLLQAAAHLAVAGIISTRDYQRLQELAWVEKGPASGEKGDWTVAGGPEANRTGSRLPVPMTSAGGGIGSVPLTSSGVKRRLAAASSLAPAPGGGDGGGSDSGGDVVNHDNRAPLQRTSSQVVTAAGGTSTTDLSSVVDLSKGVPTHKRARLLVDDNPPSEARAPEPALASTPYGQRPAALATQQLLPLHMAGGTAAAPGVTRDLGPWAASRTADAKTAPMASQVVVRQGGAGAPQRLGLGRRLFQAIIDQLPPGAELDCVLPPCNSLTGVLYSPNVSSDAVPGLDGDLSVGAALWDGGRLHDLGVYGTRQEARKSVYGRALGAKAAARGKAGLLRQSATAATACEPEGEGPAEQQPQQRLGPAAAASSARLDLPHWSPQRRQHLQLLQQPSSGRPPLPLPLAASGSVMSGDQQGSGFVLVPMLAERTDAQSERIYRTLAPAGSTDLGLLVQAIRPATVKTPLDLSAPQPPHPLDLSAPQPPHPEPPPIQHHPSATSVKATTLPRSVTGGSGSAAAEPWDTCGTPPGDPVLPVLLLALAHDAEVRLGQPTDGQRSGDAMAIRSEGSSRLAADEAIMPRAGLLLDTLQRLLQGPCAGVPGSSVAAHPGHGGAAPSSGALGLANRAAAVALAAGAAGEGTFRVTSLRLGRSSGAQEQQQKQRQGRQLQEQTKQRQGEKGTKDGRGERGDYVFATWDTPGAAARGGPTATPFATPPTSFTLTEAAPPDCDPQRLLGEAPSVVSGQGPGPGPRSSSQPHNKQQHDPPPPPKRHEQQQPLPQCQPTRLTAEPAPWPYAKAAQAPTQAPQPQPQVSPVLDLVPSICTAPAWLGGSSVVNDDGDDAAIAPYHGSQQLLTRSKSFPTPAAPLDHLLAAVDVVEMSRRLTSSQSLPQLQDIHIPSSGAGTAAGASAAAWPGSAGAATSVALATAAAAAAGSGPTSGRLLIHDGCGQVQVTQQPQRQGQGRGRGRGRPPASRFGASPAAGPVVRPGEAP